MRSFIAIELEPVVKEHLAQVQKKSQQYCRRGTYTPEENFHITLHFLGEIEPHDVEYITEAMFEVGKRTRGFTLELGDLGFFPRGDSGVMWVGVKKNPALERLFFALEKSLGRQGFPRDKTGLTPHITLGREVEPQRNFADVQRGASTEKMELVVSKITLMESQRRGFKLMYKPIYTQPLKEFEKVVEQEVKVEDEASEVVVERKPFVKPKKQPYVPQGSKPYGKQGKSYGKPQRRQGEFHKQ